MNPGLSPEKREAMFNAINQNGLYVSLYTENPAPPKPVIEGWSLVLHGVDREGGEFVFDEIPFVLEETSYGFSNAVELSTRASLAWCTISRIELLHRESGIRHDVTLDRPNLVLHPASQAYFQPGAIRVPVDALELKDPGQGSYARVPLAADTKRRSGRTTRLLGEAVEHAERGGRALFVVHNRLMIRGVMDLLAKHYSDRGFEIHGDTACFGDKGTRFSREVKVVAAHGYRRDPMLHMSHVVFDHDVERDAVYFRELGPIGIQDLELLQLTQPYRTVLFTGIENPVPDVSLEEAHGLIQRAISAKPDCDRCELIAFDLAEERFGKSTNAPLILGWEAHPAKAAWLKRCQVCQTGQKFPWASKLDVHAVRDYMRDVHAVRDYMRDVHAVRDYMREHRDVFEVADLEHMTKDPFPVLPGIQHGQGPLVRGLTAADLHAQQTEAVVRLWDDPAYFCYPAR